MSDYSEMRRDLVDTIRINLLYPDMRLSPNQKHGKHWGSTQKHKETMRNSSIWLVNAMKLPKIEADELHVVHHFYPPDRRNRDDDNVIAAFKTQRDGVAIALGIDDKYWISEYHFHNQPTKNGKVILEITPQTNNKNR